MPLMNTYAERMGYERTTVSSLGGRWVQRNGYDASSHALSPDSSVTLARANLSFGRPRPCGLSPHLKTTTTSTATMMAAIVSICVRGYGVTALALSTL